MNALRRSQSPLRRALRRPLPVLPGLSLAGWLAISGPLALPFVGGCGGDGADPEAWSTKSQSATGVVPSTSSRRTVGDRPPVPAEAAAAPTPAVLASPATIAEVVDRGALERRALSIAEDASRSSSPLLRANGIEALVHAPASLDAAASRGLVDENRGVRFVAAMALGTAKRCDLAHLVEPLERDPSQSVRAAALATLQRCGRAPDLSPFASMVASDDPEVRANAYLALGAIGNRSAIDMVRESVGRGMNLADSTRVRAVELQAAECLVRLGRAEEIEPIRAALFAPAEQGGLTALAAQMVGRLQDERSRPMLERLVDADGPNGRAPEIRLAALEALGRLGGDPARLVAAIRPFLVLEPPLRAQAAFALASIQTPSGGEVDHEVLAHLGGLLSDRDPVVQVAAANAVLKRLVGGEGR
jgi:HEAT repeat protein